MPGVSICRGFNRYSLVPTDLKRMRTVRRTALVLPVASGWEDWFSYRDFFWNVVERIKEKTTSEMSIRFGEKTFSSIQDCQRWAAAEDDEDIPGEIVFTGTAGVCCVLAFENWVDSGGVDPYSPSFTFSCYSANETIDEIVFKSCVSPLVTDCFDDYAFVRESDHFRRQWKAEELWRVVKSWILPVLIASLVTLLYLYYSSPK